MNNNVPRFTLTQATALEQDEWDDADGCTGIQIAQLILTDSDRRRVLVLWLWLCGVDPSSKEAPRLGKEVLLDGVMVVALSLPAAEFLKWWRCAQWGTFDSTERTGSEVWAWSALWKAHAAVQAMGATIALHTALTAPVDFGGGLGIRVR